MDKLKEILNLFKKSFGIILIFTIVVNILILTAPFYMLAVYDIVMPSKSLDTLFIITVLALTFFIVMGISDYLRNKILHIVSHNLDKKINPLIYDISFKRALKDPSLANVDLLNDIHTIKNFLSSQGAISILELPWFPFYIIIMFIFSPIYGLYGIIVAIIVFIITMVNTKFTKKGFEKSHKTYTKAVHNLQKQLQNVEIVEALGMRKNLYKVWEKDYNNHLYENHKTTVKSIFYSNVSKSTRITSSSLMYGIGAILAINHMISPGMIIAGAVLLSKSLAPITQLLGSWKMLVNSVSAYKRLNEAINTTPMEEKKVSLPDIKGEVLLKNVNFFYNKKPILKNINLKINEGEMIGIIGSNGSGKSSLIKTILGITNYIGEIRIDGAEIHQFNREELGKHIGYLPQNIELFEGTIAQNIARFEDYKDEDIIKAAKIAGVHEMILQMPDGYNSFLKDNAELISAGQKQKIALARAFYGNPKLIILDEPNSNLDDSGEIALIKALLSVKNKATIIFITHKMPLLNITDKIIYMHQGEVKLFDERDKILKLLKRQ